MSNLELVEQEEFGEVKCDFFQRGDDEIFMTMEQVAEALGYTNKSSIRSKLNRNEYLKSKEFSTRCTMQQVEGGRTVSREKVLFTEDGIYEITMLAQNSERARKFRSWVRSVIKEIRRTGSYQLGETPDVEDLIIKQAQSVKELKRKVNQQQEQIDETQNEVKEIRDTIIETDEDWRDWVNDMLNKIGFQTKKYKGIRQESYSELEDRARCRLGVRLDNLKERKREQGASKTELNETCKLDVIEQDKRLKEIYTAIVKELAVKHSV